jgi:hypothetical protein
MNPVPPHHLLSAYLDGELSASEREEVERLLEQSPEARQELLELEQVGMLLRQLPREALPTSFAPEVLEACLSDTGVFESKTPPPAAALAQNPKAVDRSQQPRSQRPSKTWLGWRRVAIGASALGLIVFFSLPKPKQADRDNVALETPPTNNSETLGLPTDIVEDALEMQLADDGNAGRAKNDVRLQQGQNELAPSETAKQGGEEAQVLSANIATADAALAPGGMNRKVALPSNADLKNLPIGQVIEAMDLEGEQVAVVQLVVADREQGLKHLKQLLQ